MTTDEAKDLAADYQSLLDEAAMLDTEQGMGAGDGRRNEARDLKRALWEEGYDVANLS
jgi:hypothetical protein